MQRVYQPEAPLFVGTVAVATAARSGKTNEFSFFGMYRELFGQVRRIYEVKYKVSQLGDCSHP